VRQRSPGRGDVGDAGGQAGGDRAQQELDRGGPVAGAHQHGRVVGVVGEVLGPGGVLLAGDVPPARRRRRLVSTFVY
jgi:hypothetical protein